MKLKLILAAVVALSPVSATASESEKLKAELEQVRAEIAALPLVKTAAYAVAVNEFCFPATPIKTDDLVKAGGEQGVYAETDATGPDLYEKAVERAGQHLMNNYAACEPAIAFVDEVVAALPERKAELDALAQRFFEINKAIGVIEEEAEATEERRALLVRCDSFIPAAAQWMKLPDAAAHPEVTEYHKKRIEECRTAGYKIAAPSLP